VMAVTKGAFQVHFMRLVLVYARARMRSNLKGTQTSRPSVSTALAPCVRESFRETDGDIGAYRAAVLLRRSAVQSRTIVEVGYQENGAA
jgi:hypothetical protein